MADALPNKYRLFSFVVFYLQNKIALNIVSVAFASCFGPHFDLLFSNIFFFQLCLKRRRVYVFVSGAVVRARVKKNIFSTNSLDDDVDTDATNGNELQINLMGENAFQPLSFSIDRCDLSADGVTRGCYALRLGDRVHTKHKPLFVVVAAFSPRR